MLIYIAYESVDSHPLLPLHMSAPERQERTVGRLGNW